MLKKIMITLASIVLLIGAGIGGLWFYAQSQSPQTDGERKLLASCLYSARGQSRENCQCVMENARGKISEEEMSEVWAIQLGDRQAGMLDQEWRMAEEDRRDRRDYEELKRLWDAGSISEQQFDRRLMAANRNNLQEVLEEARAPQKRLRTAINGIVSECDFTTE